MEELPISLYFKLEQGERADLRVVSQAAIAFVAIVEKMAWLADPFDEVRVEIVSGTEGSYDLNTLTKSIKQAYAGVQAGLDRKPALKWLVVYVVFRIVNHGLDWTQDKVMDWMASPDAPAAARLLTREEIKVIASQIALQLRPEIAHAETQNLYAILQRDPKIVGIGVSSVPRKRPATIVSSEQFKERSSNATIESSETRVSSERINVVLISPVLTNSDRRWKFSGVHGEFGASMQDKQFLSDALSGRVDIKLRQGLRMDIEVEYYEAKVDGVWNTESRSITRVFGWGEPPTQDDLFPRSYDVQADQKGDKQ